MSKTTTEQHRLQAVDNIKAAMDCELSTLRAHERIQAVNIFVDSYLLGWSVGYERARPQAITMPDNLAWLNEDRKEIVRTWYQRGFREGLARRTLASSPDDPDAVPHIMQDIEVPVKPRARKRGRKGEEGTLI